LSRVLSHKRAPWLLAIVAIVGASAPARAVMPSLNGHPSAAVAAARSAGVFDLPLRSPLGTSTAPADWWVPIVLVNFTDSTLRWTGPDLARALLDTTHSTPTGSATDYWLWASNGQVRLRGEVAATVTLPHPASWYAADANGLNALGTPHNDCGLVRDAVAAADSAVDWNRYDRDGDGFVDMLWVVHAGIGGEASTSRQSLWSITSRLSQGWSGGGAYSTADFVPNSTSRHVRVDRFTILPELSGIRAGAVSEIGVYCHEFGHALGLPDLYDTSVLGGAANMGPGNWSLMSTGAFGGDGHSPEYPVHPGGWAMTYLGFQQPFRPAVDTTLALAPLSRGGPVVEFSFQGEARNEHFLVEARYPEGFDRNIPSPGLLVTQIDDGVVGLGIPSNHVISSIQPGYRILEGDGDFDLALGSNRGDASDALPGAMAIPGLDDETTPWLRTFRGSPTNLALQDIRRAGYSTIARFRVLAPGWGSISSVPDPGFTPTGGSSRGRHVARLADGSLVEVFGDRRTGVTQCRMRVLAPDGSWSASSPFTASPISASDPVIAALPGDDLATAWTDLRGGTPQIFYRARLGGVWTPETQVSPGSGSGMAAAIAADAGGNVVLTWLDTGGSLPTLRFMVFPPGSPGGNVMTVTSAGFSPFPPSISAGVDGRTWIAWSDNGTGNYLSWFVRWSADSGMTAPYRLSNSTSAQPSVTVTAAPDGAACFAWQQVSSGVTEMHFERREAGATPRDTVLVSSSDALQDPDLQNDPTGGIHLAFTRGTSLGQQVRYMRWRPGDGWDAYPTDVSNPAQGSAGRIGLVPFTPGRVALVYDDNNGSSTVVHARLRNLDPPPALAVPPSPRPVAAFQIGPNPLVAGHELVAAGASLAVSTAMDLFDAGGRRVATAETRSGVARFVPAVTRTLEPGLYFARARAGGAAVRLVVLR
jgi:immune inhibitor A